MITGIHALFYTTDAEGARAFIRDKLGLPFRDEGEGWLIFQAGSGEVACHPDETQRHGVTFMCDDLEATMREMQGRGVAFLGPVKEETWGWTAEFEIPGGGPVTIYEPKPQD